MSEINKIETGKRIRELREAAAETQEQLAKSLEVKRQIISYYENGTRVPTLEHLISIADHYDTTTDYLLCLSDAPTTDKDIQFICNYTGLSESNVNILDSLVLYSNGSDLNQFNLEIINYFFDSPKFWNMLFEIQQYKNGIIAATDDIKQNKKSVVNMFDLASLSFVRSRDYFRDLINDFVSENLNEYEEAKNDKT